MRRFILKPISVAAAASILGACQVPNSSMESGTKYAQLQFSPALSSGSVPVNATTEALAPGFRGTSALALESVAWPMARDWASDAVVNRVGGSVDPTGQNVPTPPAPPGNLVAGKPAPFHGWSFEFASVAKRESLLFMIGADQTKIVKQAYKDRRPELSSARFSSDEVVAIVAKAIQDKTLRSVEPATGGAPAPIVYEQLYSVPADAIWNVSLTAESVSIGSTSPSRLVWFINLDMQYGETSGGHDKDGNQISLGYARVDAATGELIALNRSRKVPPMQPGAGPKPV